MCIKNVVQSNALAGHVSPDQNPEKLFVTIEEEGYEVRPAPNDVHMIKRW
jgi:hypothetical protein